MTALLIRLFVKQADQTGDPAVRQSYGSLGSGVGIACNVLLCTLKISIGLLTGSLAIVADGLNNLSDMGSSVLTLLGFRLANKPADSDHPFGHGRMEHLSAFLVSVMILLVGFELLKSSVTALIAGDPMPTYTKVSLAVLGISVLLKLWMFFFNRRLGRLIDSSALEATATDSRNDAVATASVLAAGLLSLLLPLPFNLDAVMAIGVALFILWSGFVSAKETVAVLLGGPPDPELVKDLERTILSFDGFLGIHDLIVHNYGPGRQFASVHVEVPQDVNIVTCHESIDLCEKFVHEKTGVELVIHMDPVDTDDESVAATRQAMSDAVKTLDPRFTIHDFRMTPKAKNRTNLIFDVVLPADYRGSTETLQAQIGESARQIDPTFCCVITFDRNYT